MRALTHGPIAFRCNSRGPHSRLLLPVVALMALLMTIGFGPTPAVGATEIPPLWTAGGLSAGLESAGQAARIASDASGNVAVVSGPSGGRDLAVTSYTPTGSLRWRSTVSPASGTFQGDWVVAAPNGDFIAIGHSADSHGRPITSTMVRFASGGALLWRVDFSATFFPAVARLVVDSAGNAYVAWSATGSGLFLQKYSPSGTLLWSRQDVTIGGGYAVASSLALSPDGAEIVATGSVSGGATWITALYDATTGVRRWGVAAPEGTAARDVVMDATRVYVTGQGVTGAGTPALAYHLTVVAYDRPTGARVWRTDKKPADASGASGLQMALAPDGSLVVAGQAIRGFLDWYTLALETSGTVRWEAVRDGGLNTDEIPRAVLVLANGTTVVTGPGGPNLPGGYIQGVTAGYSRNGTLLWEAFSRMATVWAAALPGGEVCATGGYDALITCWRLAAAPPQPPVAPSGLTASLSGPSILLTWQDNSVDETAFSIEKCLETDCTNFAQIGSQPADATSFAHGPVAPGVYNYRVRASNAAGFSDYSNTANIIIIGVPNAAPVAVMSASPTSGVAPLTVAFDGSASYDIDFGFITTWVWSFGDGTSGSGVTVTHVYAAPGTYTASLTVIDNVGTTGSTSATITVAPSVPTAPANVVATSPSRARIALTWTNTASNATTIIIERCDGKACTGFATVAQLGATATSWADSAVQPGTIYRYRLRADNATGSSPYSNIATVKAR